MTNYRFYRKLGIIVVVPAEPYSGIMPRADGHKMCGYDFFVTFFFFL